MTQANQIGRITISGSITEYPVAYQPQFGILPFPSSTEVEFFWDKPSTNLGRGITFPDGSLVGKRALPFKVPAGASPGIHVIYTKKGGTSTVEAKFTVE